MAQTIDVNGEIGKTDETTLPFPRLKLVFKETEIQEFCSNIKPQIILTRKKNCKPTRLTVFKLVCKTPFTISLYSLDQHKLFVLYGITPKQLPIQLQPLQQQRP